MAYEHKCPHCGANLDPCEKCDCSNAISSTETKNVQSANESVKNDDLIFYDTKDMSRMLGCSIPTAREFMRRSDFPLIATSKHWRVSKAALEKWAMERRA